MDFSDECKNINPSITVQHALKYIKKQENIIQDEILGSIEFSLSSKSKVWNKTRFNTTKEIYNDLGKYYMATTTENIIPLESIYRNICQIIAVFISDENIKDKYEKEYNKMIKTIPPPLETDTISNLQDICTRQIEFYDIYHDFNITYDEIYYLVSGIKKHLESIPFEYINFPECKGIFHIPHFNSAHAPHYHYTPSYENSFKQVENNQKIITPLLELMKTASERVNQFLTDQLETLQKISQEKYQDMTDIIPKTQALRQKATDFAKYRPNHDDENDYQNIYNQYQSHAKYIEEVNTRYQNYQMYINGKEASNHEIAEIKQFMNFSLVKSIKVNFSHHLIPSNFNISI